jgi:cell division protein FtsL
MATLDRLAPPPATQAASAWSPRRAIAIAFFIAIAIALLQVAQTSSFAHTGQTMQRLEAQKTGLQAQVHELEAEVAALSSLGRTERAARDRLGMVPPRATEFLQVNVPAPSGVLLPRPLVNPISSETDTEPWWLPLVRTLPLR